MRHPAVAVRDRAARAVRKRAADDHRRVRLLDRLGPRHHRRELDELAVVLRLRLGPDRLHRLDSLPHQLEARLEIGAVVAHFFGVPARPDAEEKPSARDLVEARDLPWPSGSDRAGRPGRCRCRPSAASSRPPPPPASRTDPSRRSTSWAGRRPGETATGVTAGCASARAPRASRTRAPPAPGRARPAPSNSR